MRQSKVLRIKLAARRQLHGASELAQPPLRRERALRTRSDLVRVVLKVVEGRRA